MNRIAEIRLSAEEDGEIRVLAPTGVLGAGFDLTGFRRGIAARPHVIACDAGSTDSGPSALGSGRPKPSTEAVRRDLKHLLRASIELGVPLIIGSCGTSGRDDGVDGVAAIACEIAQQEGMTFRLGLAYSQLAGGELQELWDEGRVHPLDPAPVVDRTTLERSTVVAMMGVEPIEHLLSEGCDVILTGRTSDTALFAALPDLLGADPGLNWHAAKTVECGAACAIPPTAGGLLTRIRSDHFTVETLDPGSRLTPRSVAAHTLYENADPYRITEPAGVLDTRHAVYEAVDERTVRVSGGRFDPAAQYSMKLEGAELIGYQTVIVGGIRDNVVMRRLPDLIKMAQRYFAERIDDLFEGTVTPQDIDIDYRLLGAGAVSLTHETFEELPHEIGVLIIVTAPEQEIAHKVATFVAHVSSHLPIPEYDGLVTTVAYPFSPPEIDRGALYGFTLNHVVRPVQPRELVRTLIKEI